ncbi:MAG TPA: hypothetical protein VNO22_01625 [Planctomycetota bacterium]|nr:hypothetical protein [Planctomycetota bacterium]
MKHLALGVGILIVAAAAVMAPAPASLASRERTQTREAGGLRKEEARPVASEAAPGTPFVRVENQRVQTDPVAPAAVSGAPRPPSAGDPRRLGDVLARELELSSAQQTQVAEILRQRQEAVEAYHRELRASGVFRPRDYDRRVGTIVDLSYTRIAQVLDAAQNRKFAELVRTGRLGDAVPFDIEPHMVVLE